MSASRLALDVLGAMPGIVYATDREGRVLLANPSFLALVGSTLAQVFERRLDDVLPLHLVAQAMEHEQQVRRVEMPLARQIQVDGPAGAERTWLVTKFPLRDEGAIVGVGTVVTDVTDQVREGAAAHREASFMREILERVPNLLYAKDRRLRFTFANRAMAELLGSSPGELLGRTERELGVTGADLARSEREEGAALASDAEVLVPEEPRHDVHGGQHWFRTTRHPLRVEAGRVEQLLVVATDITDYRNAQRARMELQEQRMEAIGRLAGGIAHDLNNLLTVMQSGAGVLAEMIGSGSELSMVVGDIARASARAARLTQQLLAYSRRQMLQPERVDLSEVVAAREGELRAALGEAVELRMSLAAGLPPVLVDKASVAQILMSLADNALDAMQGGGVLSIETRRGRALLPDAGESDVVELIVTDTGHGIAPDVIDKIFEPFFTTRPQGKGTGLGLSMVQGIVRQSGGDVVVASEEGRGARFTVRLPVAPT